MRKPCKPCNSPSGASVKGQVGGGRVNGFDAVRTGQPVFYELVQPDIRLVAKAVKEKYSTVCMAYVECTEVSAYSDTIREAMRVPVHDPIHTAAGMINSANNHNFRQARNKERIAQMASTLKMPVSKLVKHGVLDALAQLPEEGARNDPLYDERQRARAMQIQTNKIFLAAWAKTKCLASDGTDDNRTKRNERQ